MNVTESGILPIGTILEIRQSEKKLMIVGRRMINLKSNVLEYYDYTACLYPEGIVDNNFIFFNEEDINNIILIGISDDVDKQLIKRIKKWEISSGAQKARSGKYE